MHRHDFHAFWADVPLPDILLRSTGREHHILIRHGCEAGCSEQHVELRRVSDDFNGREVQQSDVCRDVEYGIGVSGLVNLQCETTYWKNPAWKRGELFSNTSTTCQPGSLVIQT